MKYRPASPMNETPIECAICQENPYPPKHQRQNSQYANADMIKGYHIHFLRETRHASRRPYTPETMPQPNPSRSPRQLITDKPEPHIHPPAPAPAPSSSPPAPYASAVAAPAAAEPAEPAAPSTSANRETTDDPTPRAPRSASPVSTATCD